MNQQITVKPETEFLRLRKSNKNQVYLAKILKRTQASISQALQGRNKILLKRIHTHLNWLDKQNNNSKNNNE